MIAVICPACPPDGGHCHLCGDVGTVDAALLYDHEPKIRAEAASHICARPLVVSRPPLHAEPPAPQTALFAEEDWIRFRDLIAAIPACLLAVVLRLIGRRR